MSDTASPASDAAPRRAEAIASIITLARFAIMCTFAFGALLLLADVLIRHTPDNRFLPEPTAIALAIAIAIEAVAGVAAGVLLGRGT